MYFNYPPHVVHIDEDDVGGVREDPGGEKKKEQSKLHDKADTRLSWNWDESRQIAENQDKSR